MYYCIQYTIYYIYTHTIYNIKRSNICKISSMMKSRPLQCGFSEAEAEMEFEVQALIRDQLPMCGKRRKQDGAEGEAETQCKSHKASGNPGVLQ